MEGTPPGEPEPETNGSQQPQPEPEPEGSDDNPRRLCGIDGFRSVLVRKYAAFATEHCMTMAPKVFGNVIKEQEGLFQLWGWTTEEEHYDDKQRLITVLQTSVRELLNEGRTLDAGNVLQHNNNIFVNALRKDKPDRIKMDLKIPIDLLLNDMMDRAVRSAKKNKFMRFPKLMKDLLEACRVMIGLSKAEFETKINEEIAKANMLMTVSKAEGKSICVPHVVFSAQQDLVELTNRITALPKLALATLSDNPALQLAHAKLVRVLHAKDADGRLGCKLKGGKIMEGSSKAALAVFPMGVVIVDCMGQTLDPKNTAKAIQGLTLAIPNESPIPFAYVKSASLIDDSNPDLADWLLPDSIDQDYRMQRDELMRHRRAAELLRLVFDEDTARQPSRMQYDQSEASKRPLLRLGSYKKTYSGQLLSTPTFADRVAASLPQTEEITKDLAGFCCTPGCFRPVDAACHPCGHAVCCWDCLNEIKLHPTGEADAHSHTNDGRCPACDVTMTGTYLCWEPKYVDLSPVPR